MVARDRGAVTPGHGGDFDVRILKGVTGNGIGLERVFHALPDSIDEGGGQDGRIDGEPDLVARTRSRGAMDRATSPMCVSLPSSRSNMPVADAVRFGVSRRMT